MTEPRDLHIVIACSYGCCPGCQDCYGMSIGCHQEPCRCDKPCTCRYVDEDSDQRWRDGCERHNDNQDRRWLDRSLDVNPLELDDFGPANPCPICGSLVECGVLMAVLKVRYCLGTTKDGSPRHPLYVRADAPLITYRAAK